MFLKAMLTGMAVVALGLAQGGGMGAGGGMSGGPTGGGGGRGEQNGTPSGGGMGMRPQKETKADQMIARLKLNKDQQSEFLTILESTAKDSAPVLQQVQQSRQTLANALINGKSDAELEPFAKAVSEAQFAMTGVEVRAFQRIVALLKPNQVAKAPEAFDLMAGIFMPQRAGGGGGGRRGGR
jgi:hypothetical protein